MLNALRQRLYPLSWIALLAILGLALAPSMSQALSAGRGAVAYAEVCTGLGTRQVALDSDAAPTSGRAGSLPAGLMHLDHCALCGLAGHAPVLPAAPQAWRSEPGLGHALPRLFLQGPAPLFAWAPAQARAPPPPR